jgi:predicted nucleic acid-binding protein
MTGIDCNILVQLAIADHPANGKTMAAVEAELKRAGRLTVPALVIAEFLHVVTDAKRFDPPLTMTEALDWMDDFLKNPSIMLLESSAGCSQQSLAWLRQHRLGRKRILDAFLAATLHAAGVKRLLTSNPSDFAIFGVIETVVP